MTSLHHMLFLALNASDAPPAMLVAFAILCAKYLYFLVPLHLALVWYAGPSELRFVAIVGGLAMAGALLASGLIGHFMPTPRPFVLGIGHTLVEHRPSAAFPSNHTIVCFAWASVLAIYGHLRLALAAGVIGLLVGWSRIYLGVHFPLDIVGGAALAGIAAFAAVRLIMLDQGRTVARLDRLAGRFAPFPRLRSSS
ncbi:undecaprenyl-diphosphatase [Enterovirga sp.]|uniref:undecaprenyl-diphosphatase n=1 Tax=Enterovirga sp. TaxID=2026350 RepID=UPI002C91B49C|nr:undecaprenyl-diphosphatase [Enterovirga sp.]HMO30014.1 undecaprenyl-diphosphatase [Enterovirga sp.]